MADSTKNTPAAAVSIDEETITRFWKALNRIDDAAIIDALFTESTKAAKKASSAAEDDSEDDENAEEDEFFGKNAKFAPRPIAKELVNAARDGTQPLLYAVDNSFDERTVRALLAAGADPNAQRERGNKQTPLIAACWGEDESLAATLLNHGADVTAADGNGMNVYHVCAMLGAHNFLAHLLANHIPTSEANASLLAASEGANGMTPLQITVQELPASLQQNDRRFMLTLQELFGGMGIAMTDTFPQALAANTRSPTDVQVTFEGDARAKLTDEERAAEREKRRAAEEPTTGGRALRTEKNPDIFLTRAQARAVFDATDASGSTIAHTVSEILGTIPQAQPLLRTIYAAFAFATFDPSVKGSKLFTQQDEEGNTPLHLMLQHAYLTTSPQQASVATAMVVTTITPAIRAVAASRGLPGNALVLEQVRSLVAVTRNAEGLSCLGLCAAIAEVPAAASLSAELLALWVSVLPNPLDRRGLFSADSDAYRAFLLGWAISKQNAATQAMATNPEMAATILNPDAERRINLDMNHCIAKIVGIPNILGTAETLSVFGGLPREAALALRNESIGRAAKLAEEAAKAAEIEAKEEAEKAAAAGGCCGGATSCGSKGGDFSGQSHKGDKVPAKEEEEKAPGAKASDKEIAAVSPSKGLKWAAYGLMCMMLMGIFLPVIEFVFPSTRTGAPTRKNPRRGGAKKKNSFREDEEATNAAAEPEEEPAAEAPKQQKKQKKEKKDEL